MTTAKLSAFENLSVYYGDIHNHCAIGYGHGTIEDAFRNARTQLDFACVTVHAHWGDLPSGEGYLEPIVTYHQNGFKKTRQKWQEVVAAVNDNHEPGKFVTFLGYEWHSLTYGDHNIYFKQPTGKVIRVEGIDDLRQELRQLQREGIDCMLIPHHIGYAQGYRGINWSAYTEEFSPIVEIMSMHGASESAEAPYPYLHTMGPRDGQSMYQYGLKQGHIVGVMGSTDHHSAHPGSYGHGRLGVWSTDLTRDGLWRAIQERRTVALTGDNISLQFSLNGYPIGSVLPFTKDRHIEFSAIAGGSVDYVEVLHNNRVIKRWNGFEQKSEGLSTPAKIHVEVGWSAKGENIDWDVSLEINNGQIISVEPRFRGHEIVAPQDAEEESYSFSSWQQENNEVHFNTRTWGNATTTTPSTQGICLEIDWNTRTEIQGVINGKPVTIQLTDLLSTPKSVYLGGFRTPVCYFRRAIPSSEFTIHGEMYHDSSGQQRDWYYVRVRQHNGQWAWSSPIWVGTE